MTSAHAGRPAARFAGDLWRCEGGPADLIPLLQAAQDAFGFVPRRAMEDISGVTGVPLAEVFGVVTFYRQFRLTPVGRHVVRVCCGTACHVNGAPALEAGAEDALGVRRGETTADGAFTLETVACIGCCGLAPVVVVDDEVHGALTPRRLSALLEATRRADRGGL